MTIQKSQWTIHTPVPEQIQKTLGDIPPFLKQILYNRGITTSKEAHSFLNANLPEDAAQSTLQGMEEATSIIHSAIDQKQHIAIYGDFDADGITSTALAKSVLEELGARVTTYIPHRVEEGYGLNVEAIRYLRSQGVDLLITVDCGIRAVEEVDIAREIGLQVIITDHHQPGPSLPAASAILNPNHPQDPYPNKHLAGVGVTYHLFRALGTRYPQINTDTYLDLVALGTVADLVPLRGENRHLVRKGLEVLRNPQRQGVLSLMGAAGLDPNAVNASDISYQIAPRINASGRLKTADFALNLLLEKEVHRAGVLAQEIEIINQQRKRLMRKVREMAETIAIPDDSIPAVLFAFHPTFNQGVVGLAAGYLAEKYHRPAIVGKRDDSVSTASCRSIDDFNIIEALEVHQNLLVRYGGHPAAAGLTIENERLDEFKSRLTSYAEQVLQDVDLVRELKADLEITLEDLGYSLLEKIDMLRPLGYGNPQPTFVSRNVRITHIRRVGKNKDHLKCRVSNRNQIFEGIAFGRGSDAGALQVPVDILYSFEKNEFRGNTTLQLNIKDFRLTS